MSGVFYFLPMAVTWTADTRLTIFIRRESPLPLNARMTDPRRCNAQGNDSIMERKTDEYADQPLEETLKALGTDASHGLAQVIVPKLHEEFTL
ncbi:MAG: hypothetical protein R6W86_13545 [Marinobacter sp.]|uniref:hypothetical protein n=1 Tax=Marinobacter sp. TaxID=50741 RepID=UPI00396D9D18